MISLDVRVILSTIDPENAEKLAGELVRNNMAACVNMVPKIISVYVWEGETCRDEEVLLIIKTSSNKADECFQFLRESHPYDVPEIIQLNVEGSHKPYGDWVVDMCR